MGTPLLELGMADSLGYFGDFLNDLQRFRYLVGVNKHETAFRAFISPHGKVVDLIDYARLGRAVAENAYWALGSSLRGIAFVQIHLHASTV